MRDEIEEKEEKEKKLNTFQQKKLILWLIFFILSFVTFLEVIYEKSYEEKLEKRILSAQKAEEELNLQIDEYKEKLLELNISYVEAVSAKSCVVLCLDQFGRSAYGDIIKEMDSYGFTGVIVFRDGQVPGTKGSISVELYQELLDKGWEGAIGNSKDILVYDNFPEIRKKKWCDYIEEMKKAFEEKGLPAPSVYIPHDKEVISEIEDMLGHLGMTAYTTLKLESEEIYGTATEINVDSLLNMKMIMGKYSYESLSEDLKSLAPEAKSMAVWFQKIEYGAPNNSKYTSIYMFRKHLERLSIFGEYVAVTTLTGYQEYQKELFDNNQEKYNEFQIQKHNLLSEISSLNSEISENYARACR